MAPATVDAVSVTVHLVVRVGLAAAVLLVVEVEDAPVPVFVDRCYLHVSLDFAAPTR